MTPETARRLAAILAPHLAAMRAVTAGTQYACGGEDELAENERRFEEKWGWVPPPTDPGAE